MLPPQQVTLPAIEPQVRAYLLRNRGVLRRLDTEMRREPALRVELDAVGGIENLLSGDPVDPVSLLYIDKFLTFQNTFLLSEMLGQSDQPIPQWEQVAQEVFRISKIATDTLEKLDGCCAELNARLDQLSRDLELQTKELKTYADRKAVQIITQTAEETANRVVGESYYKVLSTTTNAPTIVMVYKEGGNVKYPRRCQLKFKIDMASEDITDAYIDKLRKGFASIKTPYITYGPVRAVYVSEDKKFRNVLFVKEKADAVAILTFMYNLLGREFHERNLSLTTGRNRKPFNKRIRPLDGIEPFQQDYSETFRIYWYRIVLLVAGIEKPIILYRKYDL